LLLRVCGCGVWLTVLCGWLVGSCACALFFCVWCSPTIHPRGQGCVFIHGVRNPVPGLCAALESPAMPPVEENLPAPTDGLLTRRSFGEEMDRGVLCSRRGLRGTAAVRSAVGSLRRFLPSAARVTAGVVLAAAMGFSLGTGPAQGEVTGDTRGYGTRLMHRDLNSTDSVPWSGPGGRVSVAGSVTGAVCSTVFQGTDGWPVALCTRYLGTTFGPEVAAPSVVLFDPVTAQPVASLELRKDGLLGGCLRIPRRPQPGRCRRRTVGGQGGARGRQRSAGAQDR
jgi:hypothetical protein